MNWVSIALIVLKLLPAIIAAIKAIEELLPEIGHGTEKLALIRSMIESIDAEATKAWLNKHPHDFIQKKTMIIAESTEELFDMDSGEVKRRALAKLTEAEKIALGLVK